MLKKSLIYKKNYHKALHLGYCSSPRSASDFLYLLTKNEALIKRI